ncbi:hypothetical protein [Pseudomonas sp. 65/3-MNA-CIBAN-0223]|uniref:hypothetical protein n=1 Tax=Pseudomonas sp. 65/3-MNA-CIBAN-0223 TaxID=3140476 RepID=UPI0033219A5C
MRSIKAGLTGRELHVRQQTRGYGDFLKKWFIHEWSEPLTEHQGGVPAWAVKYAKPPAVQLLFLVPKLLNSGAFPCEAAILAYAREIRGWDKTVPCEELNYRITEGLNTPLMCKHLFNPETLKKAKESLLIKDFDMLRHVEDYMRQFTLPQTADGDVLKSRYCRTEPMATGPLPGRAIT